MDTVVVSFYERIWCGGMMNIQEKMDSCLYQSLRELRSFWEYGDIEKDINLFGREREERQVIQVEFSFWGARRIFSRGFQGTILLDNFAKNIAYEARRGMFRGDDIYEKKDGIFIIEEINKLYKILDEKKSSGNIVTRIFIAVRDFFYNHGRLRASIEEEAKTYFYAFEVEEAKKEFRMRERLPQIIDGLSRVLITDDEFQDRFAPSEKPFDSD